MTHKSQQKQQRSDGNVTLRIEHLDTKLLMKNTAKLILALVAAGPLISLAIVAPNLPAALAELGNTFKKTPRRRRQQALRRLHKQHLIEIKDKGDKTTISITEEGKQRIVRFNLDYLSLPRPKQWDRKWRVITFDIPEKFQQARRALRMKMKGLGFFPLQKSVFVYPHPCRDEIDFIASFFNIGKYLNYLEATHIDDENYLREYFHI